MTDLKPLGVTSAEDLAKKPIPETPPDIHKVEVTPEPDWQKEASLTIGESLGRFFRSIGSTIDKAVEVVSDVQKIVAGLKWVLILAVVVFVFYLILHYL